MALYEKYLRGECTPEELEQLRDYSDEFVWQDTGWIDPAQQDAVYRRLSASMDAETQVRRLFAWRRVAVAAAVIAVAAVGLWRMQGDAPPTKVVSTAAKIAASSSAGTPGGNKAVLILADGSEIALNEADSGRIASQGDALVSKTGHGQLVYQGGGSQDTTTVYNTIAIPRGGQYSIALPDGSRIWINAASRLRFPVRFSGPERIVELEGEAYFEVARNERQPFRVRTRNMDVEVLGTRFNVNAYADEPTVSATLLEGKVRLHAGGNSSVLTPGWEGTFTAAAGLATRRADIDRAMAWKNGYFVFNDEPLHAIMRKVSRWYDVDVRYAGANANLSYAGTISRFKNVQDVLHMLALTGTVRFSMEGNVITVTN
ncbi:FecR family protein [Chitinophaga lutea]